MVQVGVTKTLEQGIDPEMVSGGSYLHWKPDRKGPRRNQKAAAKGRYGVDGEEESPKIKGDISLSRGRAA